MPSARTTLLCSWEGLSQGSEWPCLESLGQGNGGGGSQAGLEQGPGGGLGRGGGDSELQENGGKPLEAGTKKCLFSRGQK